MMPEANQLIWTHKELVTLLIKAADIHDGRWYLMMNLTLGIGNFGPSDDHANPGAFVAIANVGIQREPPEQKAPAALVVDAAEVNPLVNKTERSPVGRQRRKS
jgi:hypothetical protein